MLAEVFVLRELDHLPEALFFFAPLLTERGGGVPAGDAHLLPFLVRDDGRVQKKRSIVTSRSHLVRAVGFKPGV